MTRNLFHGTRVRQLHKERRRKADRALKAQTTDLLLGYLRQEGKRQLAERIQKRVGR